MTEVLELEGSRLFMVMIHVDLSFLLSELISRMSPSGNLSKCSLFAFFNLLVKNGLFLPQKELKASTGSRLTQYEALPSSFSALYPSHRWPALALVFPAFLNSI